MEEKKFQFVEEQVKPNKKRLAKEGFIKILKIILAGIVFGVVAGLVIIIMTGKIHINGGDASGSPAVSGKPTKNASTPRPKPTPTPKKTDNVAVNISVHELSEMYSAIADFCDLYDDTIVTVAKVTEATDMFEQPVINSDSFSGLVIKVDNDMVYVLTQYDGLKENNRYKIVFRSGESSESQIVGTDSATGLAVIAAATEDLDAETINSVRTAVLNATDPIDPGDLVIAIGNPVGNMYSNMYGIVGGYPEKKYVTDKQINLYRTDMRYISDGSGVVMNSSGQVIGVITHRFDDEYTDVMTFIGMPEIYGLIKNMMENGSQATVGITASDISQDYYESLGVTSGIYVTNVANGSAAMAAGISVGDVILSIAGENIDSVEEYSDLISSYKAGDTIPVVIYRTYSKSDKIMNLKITLKDTSI